jgi:hypothetical protein
MLIAATTLLAAYISGLGPTRENIWHTQISAALPTHTAADFLTTHT